MKQNIERTDNTNSTLVQKIENLEEKVLSLAAGKVLRPESRRDMRSLAFHFVYAVDRFDYTLPLSEIIQIFKEGFNLDFDNDALAITMANGAINQREELDTQIKPLLKNWRFERLGCCTRLILRLALWELQQTDAIPSIVINEAIELAKAFAEKDAYKFINGILDEATKHIKKKEGKKTNEKSKQDNFSQSNKE